MRVITLNDDAALIDYAKPIVNELRANMVRVDADFSATLFKAKIANAGEDRQRSSADWQSAVSQVGNLRGVEF